MAEEKLLELKAGLKTAYIDGTYTSNVAYRPQFVSNNHKEGKKVLSFIEDELLTCDQFQISVAFITMSGIAPLLQTLKELEKRGIPGEILTTNYLNFSEPRALERLNSLSNITLKMYDVEGVHQEYIAQPTLENEEVDIHNFEDEFYRMSDKIAHDYINDNINDTLHLANSNNTHEDVTNMDSEAFKSFYHKVKNVDINDVTPEEREQLSIIREELKPEQVESKRHTWFNFMPAKELPEGNLDSYSSDQIFSSLEFDLLGRNAREVYKYEKDDLFLNEVAAEKRRDG